MQSIFAEAYQRSLGRSGDQVKKGQKSLEELYKAMEKGNVYSSKVLPYVAEIAKQMASGGISEARMSAFAEKNRFFNAIEEGWKKFTKGGGANGIATFWKDLTGSIGRWWEDNSAALGKRFEGMVLWFTAIRASITESIQTLWTGEETSISEYLREKYSVDLQHIREFLSDMWEGIKHVAKSVAQGVGLLNSEGNLDFAEFKKRVGAFITGVMNAVKDMVEMFKHLGDSFSSLGLLLQGGLSSLVKGLLLRNSNEGRLLNDAVASAGKALVAGGSGTWGAAAAATKLVTPSTSWQERPTYGKQSEELKDYAIPSLTTPMPFTFASILTKAGMDSVMAVVDNNRKREYTGSLSPVTTSPSSIFPYNRTDELGRVLRPVTPENALPAPSVTQKQSLDVNVNLTVSGDPESVKAFASQELKAKIAESVPDMVDYMIDEKWNYKLRSALVNGVKP